MRRLIWAFVLLSPFIALSQNYHLTMHAIPQVTHQASAIAAKVAGQLTTAVHAFLA